MCRGIGSFPWMPGYPAPHPATAHAAATASLFSSPALQQQLDIYYRQVAATQAAAAAQVLHHQKEATSSNGGCLPNLLPSIQIPTPGPHLPQANIHYKVLPSMLPIVSSPSTPLSLSPSKSGKGISAQSSPAPQNPDGMSPSPPPISVPPFNPSQIPQTHRAFSVKAKSSLDGSKLGLPTAVKRALSTTSKPLNSVSISSDVPMLVCNTDGVSNGNFVVDKDSPRKSPVLQNETKNHV